MKTHFLLLILFLSFSAPLYAQDSESNQTPDSIGDIEQELIPNELEEPNPLNKVDARLMQSAYGGKVSEAEVSVAKGANANVQDGKGRTPLILAASKGHTSVVAFLVANGAGLGKWRKMPSERPGLLLGSWPLHTDSWHTAPVLWRLGHRAGRN